MHYRLWRNVYILCSMYVLPFIYVPSHHHFYMVWITVITIAYEAMSFLYLVNHCQIIPKHSYKVLYLMKHCDFYTLWHTEMFIYYDALLILYVVMHCIFGTENAKKVSYVVYHHLYLVSWCIYCESPSFI